MANREKDKMLVVDVEACCWYGNPPKGMHKEIIEIGLVVVDFYTKEINETKSIIVKPKHSEISKFCTKLTSLTPEYVEKNGVSFKKACKILQDDYLSNKRTWFSWGDYDRFAIQSNCELHKTPYPFGRTHFNQKALFALQRKMKRAPGVQKALEICGLEFEGVAHRGKWDAYNIARLLREMFPEN